MPVRGVCPDAVGSLHAVQAIASGRSGCPSPCPPSFFITQKLLRLKTYLPRCTVSPSGTDYLTQSPVCLVGSLTRCREVGDELIVKIFTALFTLLGKLTTKSFLNFAGTPLLPPSPQPLLGGGHAACSLWGGFDC
jgi:hypothetical protein